MNISHLMFQRKSGFLPYMAVPFKRSFTFQTDIAG
jgi:hypothetical protein